MHVAICIVHGLHHPSILLDRNMYVAFFVQKGFPFFYPQSFSLVLSLSIYYYKTFIRVPYIVHNEGGM